MTIDANQFVTGIVRDYICYVTYVCTCDLSVDAEFSSYVSVTHAAEICKTRTEQWNTCWLH